MRKKCRPYNRLPVDGEPLERTNDCRRLNPHICMSPPDPWKGIYYHLKFDEGSAKQ